jgi:hypothetical protein
LEWKREKKKTTRQNRKNDIIPFGRVRTRNTCRHLGKKKKRGGEMGEKGACGEYRTAGDHALAERDGRTGVV